MAYHTAIYLFIFLPAVLLAYQITPRKFRGYTLLAAGYSFFWIISRNLLIYLLGTTLFTHYIGVWLGQVKAAQREALAECGEKAKKKEIKGAYKKKERRILTFGILTLLGVLAYVKYYQFFFQNVNGLLEALGTGRAIEIKRILVPIGISFYTLQAIGYMVDVYWDKISAQQPLKKVALFLAFFPQIMEGPIALYDQTAHQLWEGESLTGKNLSEGCLRILWGLFKKMLIADRLFLLVKMIFDNYQQYHGVMIAVGAVAYTIQLYMEFSGSMDIIIGTGRMFGVVLPENFRQPFAAKNAAEFWRRWHITLGVWLKTYVFYPASVSGIVKKWNRFGKKNCGKYLTRLGVSAMALFPVWLCNGLWHGPRWSYIFYGMYYFGILLVGEALEPVRNQVLKKLHLDENALYWRIPQMLKTWLIIFTGELFFRANGLKAGIHMFLSLFRDFQLRPLYDGTLLNFGLDKADYGVILIGCAVVGIVGFIRENQLLEKESITTFRLPVRWAVYYALILAVVIFGAYGIGYQQVDLIYAGF